MSEPNSSSNHSTSPPPQNNKEKEKEKDADRPKLKILALHGYRQNGAVFRAKIGSFRKAVAKYAQLVFVSAPHKVVNEDGGGDEVIPAITSSASAHKYECYLMKKHVHNVHNRKPFPPWWDAECTSAVIERKAAEKRYNKEMITENLLEYLEINTRTKRLLRQKKHNDSRSWWFNAEDNTFSGKCLGGPALGFEATLEVIKNVVAEHGPFDGFMGFSQGACLVGLLAAMQQKGYLPYEFKFAIFTSGFRSGSLVHKGFYDEEITLPSLHVYGESDSIIPKEMSESLINLFIKPVVAEHSGGHYVACSGAIKDAYQDFLSDRYQEMLEANHVEEEKDS